MEEKPLSNLIINTIALRKRLIVALRKYPCGKRKLGDEMKVAPNTLLKFLRGSNKLHLNVLCRIDDWLIAKGE